MAAARVIVIYGSETGGSKSKISTIVANWQKRAEMKFSIKGMMEGNDAATKFDTLKDEYDVIILCTSSFGDGDPPSGYENFLGKLYKGAAAGEESPKPLAGMQHVVLGFGSTVYDTFQNCPRLSDRLLESCGSRRFAKRVEVDECETQDGYELLKSFEADIFTTLQKPPSASAPPPCAWTEPASEVVEKNELAKDDGGLKIGIAVAVVVAVVAVAYFRMM